MDAVRVAVIGAGGQMGRRFVNILMTHPGASLVAVADLSENSLGALVVSEAVRRYTDYVEMLGKHPEIEAVIIATPDGLHRDPCLASFERGCHVLVEKPLADSLEDARAIVESARKSEQVMLVGHLLRFDPRYVQAYQAISSGEIGEVVSMVARRNDYLRSAYRIGGRTSPLFFLGIHDLDVFHWFLGETVARVSALKVSKRLQELGVEDGVFVRAEFPSGAVATLEASWLLPDSMGNSDSQLEVVGTKGALYIDAYHTGLRIHAGSEWKQPDSIYAPMMRGMITGALRTEVDHFLDCIAGRSTLAISPEDALLAVEVAISALNSAESDGAPQTVLGRARRSAS